MHFQNIYILGSSGFMTQFSGSAIGLHGVEVNILVKYYMKDFKFQHNKIIHMYEYVLPDIKFMQYNSIYSGLKRNYLCLNCYSPICSMVHDKSEAHLKDHGFIHAI